MRSERRHRCVRRVRCGGHRRNVKSRRDGREDGAGLGLARRNARPSSSQQGRWLAVRVVRQFLSARQKVSAACNSVRGVCMCVSMIPEIKETRRQTGERRARPSRWVAVPSAVSRRRRTPNNEGTRRHPRRPSRVMQRAAHMIDIKPRAACLEPAYSDFSFSPLAGESARKYETSRAT
jgi:hypothetical protein